MLEIGSLIDGKYRLLSVIGRGGMSIAYMAINEKANKTWAIKEVRKDGVLDYEAVKQGLIVETDMLKKLKHPNLPSIVDVIEDDTSFLIVMDYIEGVSLQKALEETGTQLQQDVIEWAKQLSDVLGYLHSRVPPIIYRDMKPANIMLKPDGNLTLIDFGTAREFKVKNLADTTCLGTVGYAAPEQFGGMGQTDPRTDIYCLGATLYHLVTGCNPSEPPYEIKPIREINPGLSSGLEKIIQKCTQRNPDDRYQSAAELSFALDHYEQIDDLYRRSQKKKLGIFVSTLVMSAVLGLSGMFVGLSATKSARDTYQNMMNKASKATDYEEKVAIYQEGIAILGQEDEEEAYIGLIQAYKEDLVFSVEEANQIEKLITNNKVALQKRPEVYTEICFETAKLFWYYYNYGDGSNNQITKAKSSIEWFEDVVENAPDNYPNIGMSKVYASIGVFYRDITTDITEANDKGKYKPFYDNLMELIDTVAMDDNESEIVRLELLELSRSAIQQYATKFKGDGISQPELEKMIDNISNIIQTIETTTDKTTQKKELTIALISDTKSTIETAFATRKEASENVD